MRELAALVNSEMTVVSESRWLLRSKVHCIASALREKRCRVEPFPHNRRVNMNRRDGSAPQPPPSLRLQLDFLPVSVSPDRTGLVIWSESMFIMLPNRLTIKVILQGGGANGTRVPGGPKHLPSDLLFSSRLYAA